MAETKEEKDEPPKKKRKLAQQQKLKSTQNANLYTHSAKNTKNKSNNIQIKVKMVPIYRLKQIGFDALVIHCVYAKDETFGNIFDVIQKYLNVSFPRFVMKIYYVTTECAAGGPEEFKDVSITKYKKRSILSDKLVINVEGTYHHQIMTDNVSCPEMVRTKTLNPMKCSIYKSMKRDYSLNQKNLSHLNSFTHFKNEIKEKPECKFNEKCSSFIRLEAGGNAINDQCHLKLYRHPPRMRNIKLAENIHSFVFNKESDEAGPYKPTKDDKKLFNWNKVTGFLKPLIDEVILNGFKSDLCLECGPNDTCKHSEYAIMQIVDQKMEHSRHVAMGKPLSRAQMLALILYTGCECNYDLCASQRKKNYKKWKWFDCCLFNAIRILSLRETGNFEVYSGLNGVKISSKVVKISHFTTYMSTSWSKDVATQFMGNEGMVLHINEKFKDEMSVKCCDVSWVSKFEDEREILFARTTDGNQSSAKLSVLDDSNGIQTVSVEKADIEDLIEFRRKPVDQFATK
eukprot:213368_1